MVLEDSRRVSLETSYSDKRRDFAHPPQKCGCNGISEHLNGRFQPAFEPKAQRESRTSRHRHVRRLMKEQVESGR